MTDDETPLLDEWKRFAKLCCDGEENGDDMMAFFGGAAAVVTLLLDASKNGDDEASRVFNLVIAETEAFAKVIILGYVQGSHH